MSEKVLTIKEMIEIAFDTKEEVRSIAYNYLEDMRFSHVNIFEETSMLTSLVLPEVVKLRFQEARDKKQCF